MEDVKGRKRMVVEEVEEKTATEPQILDEAAKVSSSELISNDNIQLTPDVPVTQPVPTGPMALVAPVSPKKQMSPVFWIIIPGIFLLGAILGGIVFYQKGVNKGGIETPTPLASSVPTFAPSASPSASVNLSKYTVDILNGSGIAGEAGKVKTLLTTSGFTVGTTGNAATYDYTKTVIKAKSTVDATFVSALSTALGKTYTVDTAQTLATSSASDIQVVVGNLKQ